jgi:hypothetical protein
VTSPIKDVSAGWTFSVAEAAISEAWDRMLDRIGWAVAGRSTTCDASEDRAGSIPVAIGSTIPLNKDETTGWIDSGSCVTSPTREVSAGCMFTVAEAAMPEV